ncbi:hypothetical protein L198_08126 [Cryptococcus wingfieldii CBS 7118]|uniref:Ribosomal RNA-processing protein 14/surfeit locus protein 6 C-terminal domain-containing protein n=1 Tax=Cryptococcus wingfieldii CBS 7118 TaxID=1295528 RepID=A0A1E3HH58_9TREE|nr:hypothetical protein L198_08126 [Cryptococcus wingfieldii CBS 7118]ODN75669.1 hypothetical protein L198_08126 [Cryptococcus wingfieldii CBS 7118]
MSATTQEIPAELYSSLEKHDAAFTQLLSLIPAQYYIALAPEEADNKWMINKKRKTGEELKESKKKSKHAKLDPANNRTTVEILAQGSGAAPALTPLPPSASISELRAKLQMRLDHFRRNRAADAGDSSSFSTGAAAQGEDAASRDALEQEQRRKRGEMRDRRRNERKEERRKEKAEKDVKKEKKAAQKGPADVSAKPAKTQLIVPQLPAHQEDSLSFPSVSLPSSSSGPKSQYKRIANPSQALAHLENQKAKLAALPEEKRKEAEERERWAKAEERASGGKVADQEKVLKNAVKRKEKGKAKSGKEWSERKRELQKSSEISIKKRNDNLAKRLEDKRNKRAGGSADKKKGGSGGKKGGSGGGGKGGASGGAKKGGRPGFEGGKGKK